MATSTTLVTILLLLALCAHCIIPAGSVVIPFSACCISFISKEIPESRIVSYQISNRSVCTKTGVIFTTRKGKKFCGDPKHHWVQRCMKNLDAKKRMTSPGTTLMATNITAPRHPINSASI